SSFVVSGAIFSSQSIPAPLKILFALVFTLCVYGPISTNEVLVRLKENESNLLLLAGREVFIGLVLGFVTRFFFFAISMAGEIVSISMGLGQAQIFNPMMGSMGNAMEQFYVVIGTLVFLSFNGHHIMLQGLVESFQTAPLGVFNFEFKTLAELVLKTQDYFILGIKIAAPILISMTVVQFGIALLSRVVPQINVLVTTASLTVLLGFVIMFVSLPLLVMQMGGMMTVSLDDLFKLLRAI
ncbi:MAG: flagellar biosynthetic protein FliR, partial [Bdellovibrionaceae bacterium]|nr:flagellar biosynthetic protein FliR [Pseudobdellovibrionaceae bacterium]